MIGKRVDVSFTISTKAIGNAFSKEGISNGGQLHECCMQVQAVDKPYVSLYIHVYRHVHIVWFTGFRLMDAVYLHL